VSLIFVPYHQDERLPDGTIPLPAQAGITTVAPDLPDGDLWQRLGVLYDGVAEAVAGEASTGSMPTVVSGDCLVSLAVVAGAQRAGLDPSIIWLDAHGDVHTMETSTSGYLGGMSLRFLLGSAPEPLAARLGVRPLVERQATLVDARDLDPAEAEYLASAEIRRRTVHDVETPETPVVLHVDIDVIDGAEVPGLLFPVPGGPTTRAVLAAVRRIVNSGNVVALDLACTWQPGAGEEICARLLAEIAG
jgi:arginase